MHLRELWLQGTSAIVIYKSLDYTKVVKPCYLEIVSYIGLKGQRLNPLTH